MYYSQVTNNLFSISSQSYYSFSGTWMQDKNNANTTNNAQWAAFPPSASLQQIPVVNELDEEHSSSDEDVDRSSSPELAGEEGEVLLRYVLYYIVHCTLYYMIFKVIFPPSELHHWRVFQKVSAALKRNQKIMCGAFCLIKENITQNSF